MGALVVQLVPLILGLVLSPLAIMALVAVLLSRRARVNGVSFLVGWTVAIIVVLGGSYWLLGQLDVRDQPEPPTWVAVLKLVLGLVLLGFAVRIYRNGGKHTRAMAVASTPSDVVAAAPQLPGWLHAVESFTPLRSGLLGFAIFTFNPVDATCAILASLQVRLSGVGDTSSIWTLIVFGIVGVSPMATPVVAALVAGRRADPFLARTRAWIGTHTGVLNAALLLVIGALQVENGLSALV